MGVGAFTRARDLLRTCDREGRSASGVCEDIVRAFHMVASFSWCAVMTTDPETRLPAGGVVEGFSPELCVPFWDNELTDPDFLKFADLAKSFEPMGTLYEALDGELERSPRYTKMYAPMGVADELRVSFVVGASWVAIGSFVRAREDGIFTHQELADVRQLLPIANRALRGALGRGYPIEEETPVVIMLDGSDNVTAMTPGGQEVLEDLKTQTDTEMPGLVQIVAAKARRARSPETLTTRMQNRHGRWLRIHMSPVEGDPGAVIMTTSPAYPGDIVHALLDSYGLTEREKDIALHICRGMSTKEIAAELMISAHTVRDHVKVLFSKANVASRGALMAQLFTDNVLGGMESRVRHIESVPAESH